MGGRNSIYLFTIFGIPIRIHFSWLIIFFLITMTIESMFSHEFKNWSVATSWTVGFATSILFFVSVLLHELAHSVVAKSRGMKVRDIVLFVFGGVSELGDEPESAGTEFIMALVGPATSILLAVIFYFVFFFSRGKFEIAAAMANYLFTINLLLGIFNLVPGFPLDGGRVLRSILWGITKDLQRSTRWASRMGSFVAYVFIFIGIWHVFSGDVLGGIWLAFIGWFLNNAALSSYSTMMVKDLLIGHKVREIVNRDCPRVPANTTVDVLVNDYLIAQGKRCLTVVEDGRLLGLVTVHSLKSTPQEKWPTMRASEAMVPVDRVKAIDLDKDLWSALEEMTEGGVNQLPVIDNGQLVGILGRDSIMSFLRLNSELKGDARRRT